MKSESRGPERLVPVAALCLAFLAVANLSAEGWLPVNRGWSLLYFSLQYGVLVFLATLAVVKRSEVKDIWKKILHAWKYSVVPAPAKWFFLAIVSVQSVHVCFGLPIYPFYDVGMFRWVEPNQDLPELSGQYRYYWKDHGGGVRIWRTRRQHIEWPPDTMGWGWNNEMTFPMTYHWPHLKKNYEYTLDVLKKTAGAEELFLGVETVDFSTGEVRFYESPDMAPAGTRFGGWWKPLFHPDFPNP